ncbi:hypothetical protein [Mycobacterium mantenii]|nr:hypothetical protein [Mycobacterium mantenii]
MNVLVMSRDCSPSESAAIVPMSHLALALKEHGLAGLGPGTVVQ